MTPQDAGVLLRAAAAGDESAWAGLVRHFSGLVWSIARGHGLASADAEDVFQTTWLRLTQHLDRIKDPQRVGAWLAATARNESLRVIRTASRTTVVSDVDSVVTLLAEHTPEDAAMQAEAESQSRQRARLLWQAFERLPDRCRALLRALIAVPPLSYAEIAAVFDMPVGSIGPTRARCLRGLRSILAESGITEGADGS